MDVDAAGMRERRCGEGRRARGLGQGREVPKKTSTSGGLVMMNGTVVRHWPRPQATRALSRAEAEDFSVITGPADLCLSAQVVIVGP